MIKDSYKSRISSVDTVNLNTNYREECKSKDFDKRHWKVIDKIIYPDGREEVREYYNTVVDDCSKLIACLMKGHSGCKGITYWAVGKGSSDWDNDNPPNPSVKDTKLLNETFRKPISADDIKFLDENDNVTDKITNKLEITVIFTEEEANGELREFGLFGGNATEALNSGIMINRKTHGLIYKTSGMRLERTIRLTF